MGELGFGYGGEWHLLRYLGRHRRALDAAVKKTMPDVREIEWFDFRFSPNNGRLDGELRGVEFLMDDEPAKLKWPSFWPSRGNVPNWDAVALLTTQSNDLVWMLVEAKAHLGELASSCQAKEAGGLEVIQTALRETKTAMGVHPARDWINAYYQHANRLAVLHHFNKHGPPSARLLNIYFLGDKNPHAKCPTTWDEWGPALEAREQHLGLNHRSDLEKQVYSMFLPVCGDNSNYGGVRT